MMETSNSELNPATDECYQNEKEGFTTKSQVGVPDASPHV